MMVDHVSENDPRLKVGNITYPGKTGDVMAHYAKPTGDEKFPGVIIIHENRGLNPVRETSLAYLKNKRSAGYCRIFVSSTAQSSMSYPTCSRSHYMTHAKQNNS